MTARHGPLNSSRPAWARDAVFYQIFPDRFARSDRVPKPTNVLSWDSAPTQQGYHGGDLLGIVEHLDHLVDLGINAIYLTPIFQSACNHRYHTHDYYQVDPLLGGNSALRSLIEAAHARQIRVMLDGVFNHASRGFFQFHDILENGPHSAWLDWFFVQGWPLTPYDGDRPANFTGWVNNRALPKFNTDNPAVREFLMQVGEHWIREFDIDGWRLDVPGEIKTTGFWEEFRSRTRAIKPDLYLVGEIWREAADWLRGDRFDATMNYVFAAAAIAFAAGERVSEALVSNRSYEPFPGIDAHTLRRPYRTTAGGLRLGNNLGAVQPARQPRRAAGRGHCPRGQSHSATGDTAANDLPGHTLRVLRRRNRVARHQAIRSPASRRRCALALPLAGRISLGSRDAQLPPQGDRPASRASGTARRGFSPLVRGREAIRVSAAECVGNHAGRVQHGRHSGRTARACESASADGQHLATVFGTPTQVTVSGGTVRLTIPPRSGMVWQAAISD